MARIASFAASFLLAGTVLVLPLPQDETPVVVTGEAVPGLEPFDDTVLEIMGASSAPGAALAVGRDGRLVLARGYGLADRSVLEPVEPTSRFRIASVSKPITAAATLKLVEEGRLSLEDEVVEILAWEPPADVIPDPRIGDVTVRDLLMHTGGWDRRASGFDPPFAADRIAIAAGEPPPASARTIVHFMLGLPLDFDPGTRQVYSNLGYAILGRVIEAVTGQSYEEHVRRAVLEPVGAHSVALGRSLPELRAEGEVRYHDARKFLSMFPGRGMVSAPYGAFSIEAMDAHGGWIASAPDLVRFLMHVDGDPTVPDLLDPSTLESMLAPPPVASTAVPRYGMGWEILPTEDDVWFHRGDLPGTTAMLIRAGQTGIALLMNGNAGSRDNAERILPMLLEAAREVTTWPAGSSVTLQERLPKQVGQLSGGHVQIGDVVDHPGQGP